MTDAKLSVKNVDKFYGSRATGVHAVRDLSMDVQAVSYTHLTLPTKA